MWFDLTVEQELKIAERITAATSTGQRHQTPDEYVATMLIAAMTPPVDSTTHELTGEPFGDVVVGQVRHVVLDPWAHRAETL
jgi:hypothetical protein